jgi:hypothetical protein
MSRRQKVNADEFSGRLWGFAVRTAKPQPESKLSPQLDECEQLLRMLSKSVLTARLSPRRFQETQGRAKSIEEEQ